ncbi:type IV pilus assembly protein PilO [Pseudomonas taetrolens]|uniref:Pilus assembly protein PilO n=1 Tax=Pseudomonas taetrolens TaxID=47884 RepID=A0A0J6GNC5_PSETA|nr:type 4a pilus biogenesis protein PilO [Pseudomonas taetrolens]KMM83624.1 pilus assembly protein PilO [Pseudomonas taetrolens]SED64444.1 type IV pilus assembly protein PilO [Pseudomonas taetrolens]SQF88366.1 type 4 fimbrial biogenesis protein PilO [Pseudomonas taetrolens]VEH51555.1 type 4 fimbrial biogenesis protein PilO [Pseudomonas taetrolens]
MPAQWLERLRSLDLRELGHEQIGAWSPRRKAVMAVVWMAILLALGYALVLHLPLTQLQQQREAEAALKTEFESTASRAAGLEAYAAQVRVLEASFSTLLKRLPGQSEFPGLLDEISRLSMASGLFVEYIEWSPEVLQSFYAELPLHMSLTGSYHALGVFISGLSSLSRIVTAHDFTLAPLGNGADGQLRMTLLARTYRNHDQGLIP